LNKKNNQTGMVPINFTRRRRMKKLTLGTALASLLALTACGETDTREKHIYTVEVEVTEPNGTVKTVSKDCKQLQTMCTATFDLETPYGIQKFEVNTSNQPAHPEKVIALAANTKSSEERDKIIDTEYRQSVHINALEFSANYGAQFQSPRFENIEWKPRTQRIIKTELNIPHPELVKKYGVLKELQDAFNKKDQFQKKREDWNEMVNLRSELKEIKMQDVKAADLKIRIY